MQEFNALRAMARQKRDATINQARADYAQRLAQIEALATSLKGPLRKDRAVRATVQAAIPKDREFTFADVMATLESLDPSRIWTKNRMGYSDECGDAWTWIAICAD